MKTLKWAALGAVAAIALTACGSSEEPAETTDAMTDATDTAMAEFPEGSTMAALADAGTITIGTKFDQPLFGLMSPSGTPEGFDVEIGKIIAGKLGIDPGNIEWVETVSANREPFIESGQVDMVVATYTINDKRKEIVSFAGPYYNAGQAIFCRRVCGAGARGRPRRHRTRAHKCRNRWPRATESGNRGPRSRLRGQAGTIRPISLSKRTFHTGTFPT